MDFYILFAVIGAVIVAFIILGTLLRRMRCHSPEPEEEGSPAPKKYDMTPSEVHEYKDFEKAIAGQIYAEKRQKPDRHSPNPMGMEKFRRIPTLASEKMRSKKNIQTAASSSSPSTQSCSESQKMITSHHESEKDTDQSFKFSDQSDFEHENGDTLRPMSSRSVKSYVTNKDGMDREGIVSSFAAKAYVQSRFISRQPDASDDQFSIANDEAAL